MKPIGQTSLRLRLTLFVAGMVVVTGITIGLVGYHVAREILLGQIQQRLLLVRSDRQAMLLNYVEHQQELVQLVASRTRLRELVDAYQAGRLTEQALREQTKPILADALTSCRSFQGLWIVNTKGVVVAATADNFLWKDFGPTPEFQQGQLRSYMGVITPGEAGGELVVAVAPMRGADNRLVGLTMALLDARDMIEEVGDVAGLGNTGEVVVGRPEGNKVHFVVPPRKARDRRAAPGTELPAMQAAVRGERGFRQDRDANGTEWLATYGPVGHLDWGMVAQIEVAEAHQPILWLQRVFLALLVTMVMVGGWGSYELARRLTRPLLRMSQMAESVAAGNYTAHLEVERQDEVGKLGQAFNRMAEALAHSHGALEQRVRERTAALTQERHLLQSLMDHLPDMIYFKDRASRFLRINKALAQRFGIQDPQAATGKTDYDYFTEEHAKAALTDEQRVIASGQALAGKEERETWPDGHVTWVSSTKVPFRDEAGHTVGTFGISRDITERKEVEQRLAEYAQELAYKNRQIEEDLSLAREVQLAFLPQRYPVFPKGVPLGESAFQFSHEYQPASTLAGDFFEVLQLSDTTVGVLICDVMGHGVRSALVMAVIRGLVDELQSYAADPGRFLAEINRALVAHWNSTHATVFASACYVVVDAATGQMSCTSAGHPSPLWLRRVAGKAESLLAAGPQRGPVLGLFADAAYTTQQYTLAVGDTVLLYTDGLVEVEGANGEGYGAERLCVACEANVNLAPVALHQRLLAAARSFAATGAFTDDICLVSVNFSRRLGG
jgi:sigma-B regulation protein RsbU (phosphoserine phosphatase)